MADSSEAFVDGTAHWLLIFAHPGHELRAHHLMERTRPTVAILTDGSGSTGVTRAHHTTELLAETGARPAEVFCALSDRDAYAALMARNAEPFMTIRDRLIEMLLSARHTAVVVDAAEGYNPVHDLCHWIGRAAAATASRLGTQIDVFELDLVSHPDGRGEGLRLALDDQAFARKLAAAKHYSALGSEADAAFDRHGRDAFRVEFLRQVNDRLMPMPQEWVPYYEQVGEARVKAGLYSSVLRYADHVRPIVESLLQVPQRLPYAEDLGALHQ
jgi:hypothetical protein